MKIIVTGGKGYIASLIKYFNKEDEIVLIGREEADLADSEQVRNYFLTNDYDLVFHGGAIPDTQTCEDYPEMTYKVNVESSKIIADCCREKNKRMIFISTEQVFNGLQGSGPFSEVVPVSSVTVYGNHKIEVEEYLKEIDLDYLVLRFSWMFGLGFPGVKPSYNILTPIIKAMVYNQQTLFTVNEKRGITYAHNVARQQEKIFGLEKGIYNISATNERNTYEAAVKIAEWMGFSDEAIEKNIRPNYDRYTDRFRDYRMDNAKLISHGILFGDLESEIKQCLKEFSWISKD